MKSIKCLQSLFSDFINDKTKSFVSMNYLNNIALCSYKSLSKICINSIKNTAVCNRQ